MRTCCIVLLWLVFVPSGAVWADFADGLRAYDAGDYAEAVAEWTPLADAGEGDALLALASLYRQGLGTKANLAKAMALYRQAALQGIAIAQVNLGDFYARGEVVSRDLVEAYMWLELAARQSHSWAEMRRDQIRAAMSATDVEQAIRKADDWRPAPDARRPTAR